MKFLQWWCHFSTAKYTMLENYILHYQETQEVTHFCSFAVTFLLKCIFSPDFNPINNQHFWHEFKHRHQHCAKPYQPACNALVAEWEHVPAFRVGILVKSLAEEWRLFKLHFNFNASMVLEWDHKCLDSRTHILLAIKCMLPHLPLYT